MVILLTALHPFIVISFTSLHTSLSYPLHHYTYSLSCPLHHYTHHCHILYSITHIIFITVTPLHKFIAIVFAPFTHHQPIVLVRLDMICQGRHGQQSYWYIMACHVKVNMGSHLIGTSWHAMSGSTRAAILLVHHGIPCPIHHRQINRILPCCSLVYPFAT